MTADHASVPDTPPDEVTSRIDAAAAAFDEFSHLPPGDRARILPQLAGQLEQDADELVGLAIEETALPEARLRGELARTTGQLRFFADVAEEGSYHEAVIDLADPEAKPAPRPDVRRTLLPLGPVVVFAASNFPFAFSVAGGDTASALAAGCPVVVKAHPGHPRLSRRTAEVLDEALTSAGAPDGTFGVIHGLQAGRDALLDPRVRAAAFTGSLTAGRALHDLATSRPDPIPFYGELGSLNPVFVTPAALRERAAAIIDGFVGSFTLGVGQFCTKPGLLFLPAGHDLTDALVDAVNAVGPGPMLNPHIRDGHARTLTHLAGHPAVRTLTTAGTSDDGGVAPTLLATTVPALLADPDALLTECFGPTAIVVEYADPSELAQAAAGIDGQLTATIHAESHEIDDIQPLLQRLEQRAGRLIWNGWPTGVAVTWAMHHGGPYPATTSPLHTSVGATAIRRFLRPVCYQSAPQDLLPEALRDNNPHGIPRRVNGRLTTERVVAGR